MIMIDNLLKPEYRFVLEPYHQYLEKIRATRPQDLKTKDGRRLNSQVNNSITIHKFLYPEKYNINKDTQQSVLVRSEVCERLGLGKDAVTRLLSSDYIETVRGPKLDGYPKWIIKSESVEKLIFTFKSRAKGIDENDYSYSFISLTKAMLILTGYTLTVVDLVKFVYDGDLCPYNKGDNEKISDFFFVKEELIDIIEARFVSVERVKKYMDESKYNVMSWVKKGFLNAIKNKHGYFLTKEGVEEFKKTYISLNEILKTYGLLNPNHALNALMNNNIHPVTGPRVDNGKGHLFLRKDRIHIDMLFNSRISNKSE